MTMGELAEKIIPEDCDLTPLTHPSELALMRKMADFGNLIALGGPRPRAVPPDPLRAGSGVAVPPVLHQLPRAHRRRRRADGAFGPVRRHPHRAGLDAEPAGRVGSGEDVGLASLADLR